MAAQVVVMPLLNRLLCRVSGKQVRALCVGRYRVNPLRGEDEEPIEKSDTDMGRDSKDLLRQFPEPKSLLHSVLCQALRTSHIKDRLTYVHTGCDKYKKVVLRLKWPKLIEVEGYGTKKIDAEREAAAVACKIFQDLGLLGPGNKFRHKNYKKLSSQLCSEDEHFTQEEKDSSGETLEPDVSQARTGGRKNSRESRLPVVDAAEDANATKALHVFSNPKHLLATVIQVATSSQSGIKKYVHYQHEGGRIKTCRLTLQWPQPMTFVAAGLRESEATRKAAALACQKLKDLGLIDTNNKPLTHVMYNLASVQKFKEQRKQPKKFQVPEHLLQRMEDYFWQFPLEIGDESSYSEEAASPMESSDRSYDTFSDPITGQPYSPLSEDKAFQISDTLERKWLDNQGTALQELPADRHREVILSAIQNNPVVVIAGDTGCGKTTRIPRFILEDAILSGDGAHCNILITQPRRISAVSVAHRVGQELGPGLRRNVGYQVRLESNLPPRGGAALFCTVGVLLKKLQSNPTLEGVSHVVVDEVHERDVNTDFLLILLKQVQEMNPNVKVVLMSATGDNERISRYFGKCPVVRVPGFMYPVKEHYLEDVLSMLGRPSYQTSQMPEECVPDLDLISSVILHIDRHGDPGGILCFLPGWQEIRGVQQILQEKLAYRNGRCLILPVHSNIPLTNQQAIFERPSPEIRKIVLATNIAETSVTIDDIVHVVDTGMHKEQRYDLRTKVSCLETTWVSKSNVTQRRGRAGRCQPGFSYHLFTRQQHQAMPTFQVPEILRTPLENLVVQAKIHTPEMTAVEFLSQALESPDRRSIVDAVRFLQEIRVLNEQEELTLLGHRVASISTDPSLAKAIVLSSIFRCLHPLLVIVSCLTKDPFHGGLLNRSEVNKVKAVFSGEACSDHLVFVRVFQALKDIYSGRSSVSRDEFVENNLLSKSALRFIQGLIAQFSTNVHDAFLVSEANECMNERSPCNQLSNQDELVKGILLAGLYPKLIQVVRGQVLRGKFRPNSLVYKTKSGPVLLHKSTVNRDEHGFRTPWLTYFQAVKSTGAIFVRDSSMVHPLAVLLMSDASVSVRENGQQMVVSLSDSDLLKLESDPRTIMLLGNLRQALSQMVERNLREQLPLLSPQEEEQHSSLRSLLVDLLNGTTHCFTDQPETMAEE
ncbi:ATP-dependent RNA helicase DHX30 isoform X2 [Mixophyes fleayi]|uniref:ATP-dependent RNA helicase DHX30 isoform X2 n=1 Tax=Mixophyes fleayi TaxID=3061075 RepID=UPI003F4E0D0B